MNRRAILAALRRAMGRGGGMLPGGSKGAANAMQRRVGRSYEAWADAKTVATPSRRASEMRSASADMERAAQARDYAVSRSKRPTRNASPISVVDNEFDTAAKSSRALVPESMSDIRRAVAAMTDDEVRAALPESDLPVAELRKIMVRAKGNILLRRRSGSGTSA